uniref:F-box domain-containing protein n=1 Tax=Brassica oleracea var. oleracea TaxID=109376 RepID=A0A0D3CDM6_BRAOL
MNIEKNNNPVKSRKIIKRCTHSSTISSMYAGENLDTFPMDLINEILKRLPAKTIAICQCVSKQWAFLLGSPHFTKSFLTCSTTRPRLLFTFELGGKWHFFSSPQPRNADEQLITIWVSLEIGKEKSSWRKIGCLVPHFPVRYRNTICINGILYYVAWRSLNIVRACFDVKSEEFRFIKLEDVSHVLASYFALISYKGKLGLLDQLHRRVQESYDEDQKGRRLQENDCFWKSMVGMSVQREADEDGKISREEVSGHGGEGDIKDFEPDWEVLLKLIGKFCECNVLCVGLLLVLGGNGFVGSHVCKEALDCGLSVSSLTRSGRSSVQESWASRVTWHQETVPTSLGVSEKGSTDTKSFSLEIRQGVGAVCVYDHPGDEATLVKQMVSDRTLPEYHIDLISESSGVALLEPSRSIRRFLRFLQNPWQRDVWTSDAALVGGGSETSGLATQIVWGVGAETFAFDAALEGGGIETDCTSDAAYESCLFMLELNFYSGVLLLKSVMRLARRSDCYRTGALEVYVN